MTINPPDIDPSNNDSLPGLLQFAFYKLLQGVDGMLPAQVVAFDRDTGRVQVQLFIAKMSTGGAQISRPQLASIPVAVFGGGGFMLNFNLSAGDFGYVIANDRDISLFLQNYEESVPNTNRVKNFADGVFFPAIMTGYTIDPSDASNALLQSLDGTVKISLGTGKITVSAPTVEVDSTGVVTVAAPLVNVNLPPTTGQMTVNGNLHVTGTFTNP